jgi:LacI family transcriptional regulator, galactose operon repressor
VAKIPKVVLLVESSRESGRSLLRGIANYAHHHGPWSFYWEPAGLGKARQRTGTMEADGIIARDVDTAVQVRRLIRRLPAVIFGHLHKEMKGKVNVVADSAAISGMAAEHLIGCGFRHFGFCGYRDTFWSVDRRDHFIATLRKAGFEPRIQEVREIRSAKTARHEKKVREALVRWLRSCPRPIGLMACNDDLGKELVEACRLAGLRVPDDAAVVGADNDEVVCGLSNPPLSSVAINFERAGYEAADVLDQLMRGTWRASARIVVRASHVVPRQSTDIFAVEDASLAKSLRFIRDHARGGVTVEETARAAGLSRRALEKRFRTHLKHSILREIRRVRTDQIARMLAETELPVSQIAETLGFEDVQHVARYFRAGKGLSPLAYRRLHGRKQANRPGSQIGDSFSQNGVVAEATVC